MPSIKNIVKKLTHPFLKYTTQKYFSKPRNYSYQGIHVLVHPEVFPPHYTISTKILLDYINQLDLRKKTFLELGCGSGIISLFASSKGAKVLATDINKTAIEELKKSAEKNQLNIEVLYSDLFDEVHNQSFDYVFINPPYYPKKPTSIKEQAWFCGEDFEYFKKLFLQLSVREDKKVLMILSEDCQINTIKNIATNNNLNLKSIFEKKVVGEKNFIYKIEKL